MTSLQHKTIQVKGHKLHYVEGTPTSNPKGTLVFLHGFPEFWGSWQYQLEYFGDEYRVIAPDLLGYNLSDKPTDLAHYQVPNLISLYASFIEAVGNGERVTLVAHDWGGAIAWPLTAFHANLLDRLVILNAAHPSTFTREMRDNPEQRQKSAYIHQLRGDDSVKILSRNNFEFLREMLFEQVEAESLSLEWQQKYLQAWQQPGAVAAMCAYYKAMPQLAADAPDGSPPPQALLDGLKVPNIKINVPTLVLWGEQDTAFVSSILDGIEDYVPSCKIIRFPTANHWLQHVETDAVNHAISEFLSTN